MVRLELEYSHSGTDPIATLWISCEEIDAAHLSVSFRTARNRTALYQAKHVSKAAGLKTRERDPALAGLNIPISEHYANLHKSLRKDARLEDRRVIAFPISDLTANPLRPHYDASVLPNDRAFFSDEANQAVYRHGSNAQLFYLDHEPIGEVPYTLLVCYRKYGQTQFGIRHNVKVARDGSLPEEVPEEVRAGLISWMACPPLLIDGEYLEEEYAIRDYDLRHLLGFAHNHQRFGYPSQEAHEEALLEIFEIFPNWPRWCEAVQKKLSQSSIREEGYNAALGLSEKELILVHRLATTQDLANALKDLGAKDAVLLDSGGSCAIWANWVNGNQGGVLANAWNFRQPRGAVLFLVLKGKRGLPK